VSTRGRCLASLHSQPNRSKPNRPQKVGVIEDHAIKDELAPLLRFWTSRSGDGHRSLGEYVKGMAANQTQVTSKSCDFILCFIVLSQHEEEE